jgi:hypothetical protein
MAGEKKYFRCFGELARGLVAAALVPALLGCSKQTTPNAVACSNLKSLFRVDTPSAPQASQFQQFFSNGGFIEVMTRSEMFGSIDKSRLCTAYVEFSDNPADVAADIANQPLKMNVYTATHCLNYSRDHEIKLHLFDGSVYRDFWVDHKPLEAVKQLRVAMRQKGISMDARKQILESLRPSATSLDALFNADSVSGSTIGTGASNKAGEICLKKNDPDFQHVCATYQDLSVIHVEASEGLPPVLIEELKRLRAASVARTTGWIASSGMAAALNSATPPQLAFPDDPQKILNLKSVHAEIRNRTRNYSKFKSIQFVANELTQEVKKCLDGQSLELCKVNAEVAAVVKAALEGTGYEKFDDSKLFYTLDGFKSAYLAAQLKMDRAFNVFEPFLTGTADTAAVNVTTRVHSNYRFVSASQPTLDVPDPKDSINTGRAFAQLNINGLTGNSKGTSVAFVRWLDSPNSMIFGRFNYFKIPRRITDAVRQNYQATNEVARVGFMQAGDSGSIVVMEHMPYFAITSVDGAATSGGSALRPLPQPMDEGDLEDVKRGGAMKKSNAACR